MRLICDARTRPRRIVAFCRTYEGAPVRPTLDAMRRIENFEEIVKGLGETSVLYEARRRCGNCFECDDCYGVCTDNAVVNSCRRARPLAISWSKTTLSRAEFGRLAPEPVGKPASANKIHAFLDVSSAPTPGLDRHG